MLHFLLKTAVGTMIAKYFRVNVWHSRIKSLRKDSRPVMAHLLPLCGALLKNRT